MTTVMDRITVDPEQCGGWPCVRGMRIRVSDVLDLLANGLTSEQITAELPDLELADIQACLRYARQRAARAVCATLGMRRLSCDPHVGHSCTAVVSPHTRTR